MDFEIEVTKKPTTRDFGDLDYGAWFLDFDGDLCQKLYSPLGGGADHNTLCFRSDDTAFCYETKDPSAVQPIKRMRIHVEV